MAEEEKAGEAGNTAGNAKGVEGLIEVAILAAFFTAILFLGVGTASGHKINHDYPVGYGASDSYQHQARAEAIKQMGQYRAEAPYMMAGLKDVLGFYPPVTYHVTALLSNLSGQASYDSLMLVIGLALALAALVAYHIAKSLGRHVGMLALPLTLFAATGKPFLGMATFGQMPFAFSSLFLATTAWALTKLELPRGYLLLAMPLAGTIMTHTSETLFLGILLSAAFAVLLAANLAKHKLAGLKIFFQENRKILTGLILAIIPTLYFWPLFIGIWLKMQGYRFNVETVSASFPAATVFPTTFGFMLIAIIAGLVFAVLFVLQKRDELERVFSSPKLLALLFSGYMLLAGLGTYAGFGLRSFQTRLFWPITLAPLAGFGIYQLVRLFLSPVLKKFNMFIAAAAITALLGAAVLAVYYEPTSGGGMTKEHWEAMRWIADNTPKEATVYVPFSLMYSQTSVLYNTERKNYFLDIPEFAEAINKLITTGKFDRMLTVTYTSDSGSGLPYRKGLFSFGQHTQDTVIRGPVDICSADYYLIDRSSPQPALQQASLYLIQQFLNANMSAEYENQYLTVLRNNGIGGDCIA
ncbi:hypothetical protein HYU16_00815 [Candidatus Woesearchaeota archaeon]|nr:hypothetical protein [Candidatus Woesearchaeota archaeon]